ncbi:hypothetical protein ABW20_dc0104590 [Dactylellina cionopaga]|nr:hypothetical protein ABW20_dc0104590 [Dactylellina cionopaga]
MAPNTPYEAKRTYEYKVPTQEGQIFQMVKTDPSGTKERDTMDGLGRVYQTELQDVDNEQNSEAPYRITQTSLFDKEGRVAESAIIDWFRNGSQPPTSQTTTRYLEYDDWGYTTISSHDPISRTQNVGIEGESYTITQIGNFDSPISVRRYFANSKLESESTSTYDGMGRLVSAKDVFGQTTSFVYDSWDRVILMTLPDGSKNFTSYAEHSTSALITDLQVQAPGVPNSTLGRRTFDGLGRVKTSVIGGRETKLEYLNSSSKIASTVTTPENKTVKTKALPELGDLIIQGDSENIHQSFTYHAQVASLLEATDNSATMKFEYFKSGQLKAELIKFADSEKEEKASYRYSMGGKLQSRKDVFNCIQTRSYDSQGRLASIRDAPYAVDLTYDKSSRLASISTVQQNSSSKVQTQITYDEFGRQNTRKLLWNSTLVWQLCQTYTIADQVSERDLTNDQGTLRNEQYEYDGLFKSQFADGSEDTATYTYGNANDPVQLTKVKYSNPSREIDFSFNASGQETSAENGQKLGYVEVGRLVVKDTDRSAS